MKIYKLISIYPKETIFPPERWGDSEELINEFVSQGWEIEHVSSVKDGEVLVMLSRKEIL